MQKNLKEDEFFNVTSEDRLGLFSTDPIPVVYGIADKGITCFSKKAFELGISHPELNESLQFETPIFPYQYEVNFCDYAGKS